MHEKKDVQIVYGPTKPLNSHSFFMAAFSFSTRDLYELSYAKGVKAK